jgi:membrane protease YdiL (CAAX protease family)
MILYFCIPLLIILIRREALAAYGISPGEWKTGLALTISGILLTTPLILYIGRENESMHSYYSGFTPGLPWNTFLDLFGWELFFRGWILFGYARKFGPDAIWLQAMPFALAHIGKPEIETFSTIFGGFAFGWVAWRTKSFIWPFLIHWYIGSLIILVSAGVI